MIIKSFSLTTSLLKLQFILIRLQIFYLMIYVIFQFLNNFNYLLRILKRFLTETIN